VASDLSSAGEPTSPESCGELLRLCFFPATFSGVRDETPPSTAVALFPNVGEIEGPRAEAAADLLGRLAWENDGRTLD
jgi:hypothetical protein